MAVRKKANAENGRHYISCTDCHKKAKTIGCTFWCESCKKEFSFPTIRLVLFVKKMKIYYMLGHMCFTC